MAALPNALIKSSIFLVESVGFSVYINMSSANNDSFTSSLSIGCLLFLFSSLIALARNSSTMLNRSGENRHPRLVPDLGQKFLVFVN